MATPVATPPPNPTVIFEALFAFQHTAALKTAIELDVFTAVGEGNTTIESLARRCAASERGVRILCDYLTIDGFLAKKGAEYSLSPNSAAFLDRRSPSYIGSASHFLNSPVNMARFQDLAAAVRTGASLVSGDGSSGENNEHWVEFARSMAAMSAQPAALMAGLVGCDTEHRQHRLKVLDVAAGHGLYGIAVAERNPNAEIVAVDWTHVLDVAVENAGKRGVVGRYHMIPGSAFDVDFGQEYDLVLITNFLHHFDRQTNVGFLRKVCAALSPGGRAATLDFVPNEDRVSPPVAAGFSLVMLAATKSGDAYTFAELEAMFRAAGFARSEFHPLPPTPQSVVISYK